MRPAVFLLLLVTPLLATGCQSTDPNGEEDPASVLGTTLTPAAGLTGAGSAVVRNLPGFSEDRLFCEVRIDAVSFGALGIDDDDGFADEVVTLFAGTPGSPGRIGDLAFVEDLRIGGEGVVRFEIEVAGGNVPSILRRDIAIVDVNQVRDAFEGTFQGS